MRMLVLVVALVVVCGARLAGGGSQPARDKVMKLPEPRTEGGMALTEALSERRSVREFKDTALSSAELGQLCWAAQGITDDAGYRASPSAGALYPIELYVATADGIGRYAPQRHHIEWLSDRDARRALARAALGQVSVAEAPACFIIAADIDRTARKYGDRAERYCILEAGHVCQNILLQATALQLGGVPIGAFDDAALTAELDLPEPQRPYYLVPVGYPDE